MLPWLALGHLLPFLELSKRLAKKGHNISFISTPKNIKRLSEIQNTPPLINFIQFPLPHVKNLPEGAEVTVDLPSDDHRPYLKKAFDGLQQNVLKFLQETKNPPIDWIVYDYTAYWIANISQETGVPCTFLSLFSGAVLAYQGSPQALLGKEHPRTTVEDYTVKPRWVPFDTTIAFKAHEIRRILEPAKTTDDTGVNEFYRFAMAIEGCEFVAVRSFHEFEPNWLELIESLFNKPIVPIGILPPIVEENCKYKEYGSMFKWLDDQELGSVVYVAFGTEAKLTKKEVEDIALGLKLSNLPYLWALRSKELPKGVENGINGKGFVCLDFVPQARILAHGSVGGFLTHGGWNSVVEGLSFGKAMTVMPLIFDQGLNARDLVERKLAIEVARSEEDGTFSADGIAESLRFIMVEGGGRDFRDKAGEFRCTFGNLEMQDKYLDDFVKYLWDNKGKKVHRNMVN